MAKTLNPVEQLLHKLSEDLCASGKFLSHSQSWSLPVVDDEPRLLPHEVEVELEGEGEGDVVDLAHLEDHDVDVDVQRLAVHRGNEVLFRSV